MAKKKVLRKKQNAASKQHKTTEKSKAVLRNKRKISQRTSSNSTSHQKWIVEELAGDKFVLNPDVYSKVPKLCNEWRRKGCFKDEFVEIDPKPFKHIVVRNLLGDVTHLDQVCKELVALPYQTMLNDLYSCQQSCVENLDGSYPAIKSLVKFIKGPLRSVVQEITGKKFSEKYTITASQYKNSDRLLCHDDNLHDRSVAFIFYLCKNWKEQHGGSLDLFDCDANNQPNNVVKSIFPSYGSFAFFEVTHNSFHQVSEVLSSKSVRLSINGWYHGDDLPEQPAWSCSIPKMLPPIQPRKCSLDGFVDATWLNEKTNAQVKESFERELSVSLPNFLKSSIFREMENAFNNKSITWESCGPANHRHYQIAKISSLPSIISQYLKIMQSKQWFRFLSECTVEISPDIKPMPMCWFEVQRWQPGDYTLLVDNDPLNNSTGIDVHLYFGVDKRRKNNQGGEVFYLGPDHDEQGNLKSFHLEPESNTATIIAHIEGMAVLTKYLDHRNKPFFKIYARYSQGEE